MASSTLRALVGYSQERFPLVNMALFAIVFLTVYTVAHAAVPVGEPAFGPREVVGILSTVSFFFRLRVFDEIKDYATDLQHFPQRVLQSGRVTLGQLRRLAWLGLALEAGWSVWMGSAVLAAWGLAVAYSLLMRYEFFVPAWLRARLVLYAFSHLLIMPLVIFWLWTAYAGPHFMPALALLALLSLLGGLAFEIARKIKAPEAERLGVDSYSRTLGLRGAIAAALLVLLAGVLVQAQLLRELDARSWPLVLLGGLYVLAAATYAVCLRRPRTRPLKAAELLVSLQLLLSYLSIVLELGLR